MSPEFRESIASFLNFISNRLFLMFVAMCVALAIICASLFDLQIVNGQYYQASSEKEILTKSVPIEMPRGEIYDRNGIPLAVNHTDFSVKIDPSINPSNHNEALLKFIELMEKNTESVADNFPISKEMPYEFLFNGSQTREKNWKRDMGISQELDAAKSYEYLIEFFKAPKELEPDKLRKLISLRSAIFMERYTLNQITVTLGVKKETIAALEENNQDFPGVYVDVDYLRYYPQGGYVSHIVGYIRSISAEEYEVNKYLGYKPNDLFGKDGIEKQFEIQLRGKPGSRTVYANTAGRHLSSSGEVAPVQGDKVFLTIDLELQKKVYHVLEKTLADILYKRLNGSSEKETILARDLLVSMLNANNISTEKIMASAEGMTSYNIKAFIEKNSGLNPEDKNYKKDLKKFIADSSENGKITVNQLLLVLYEQGTISMTQSEKDRALKNALPAQGFLASKVASGEITPQLANCDPASGAVVVTDVNTGGVLASVNYPTYDNNEFVNDFNNEYYQKLINDPTTPLVNRAFSLPRAPGSTFKMITALAGLEAGTVNTKTTIYDKGTFAEAGFPYPKCWIASRGGSHGSVNVVHALEHSCNYFFFETSYRMGNTKLGTKLEGIERLNKYMKMFGLNGPTGVEIYELNSVPEGTLRISSPEYKAYRLNESAKGSGQSLIQSQLAWSDGDTIRTAIGQGFNNYTAATMAKYVATLANGGTRYRMHFLDKLETSSGEFIMRQEPSIEEILDIKPEHLKAVYEGMAAVTKTGTAKNVFADFPMVVAGKTGTAQEDPGEADHASFTCFAPYDNPQIAIYVAIPFGNTTVVTAPAAQVAKAVLAEYFGIADKVAEVESGNDREIEETENIRIESNLIP